MTGARETICFAYGSNLDQVRMRTRCRGEVRVVGAAWLGDHRLDFVGASQSWGGHGVATVTPAPGERVPGLLYALGPRALARLDRHEGLGVAYGRGARLVLQGDAVALSAEVYVHLDRGGVRAPSPEYVGLILGAYEALGFDAAPVEAALTRVGDAQRGTE